MRIWNFLSLNVESLQSTPPRKSFQITNHMKKDYKEWDNICQRWNDGRNAGIYVKNGNTTGRKKHDIWFNDWSPG